MPTTGHGITYPASSAPPQAWVDFQNLADSVETALDLIDLDTGWVAIAGGIVTGTFRYRCYRSVVYIQVNGTGTFADTVVTTLNPGDALPVGYRPATIAIRAGAYFAAFAGTMTVGTDGNISCVQSTGASRANIAGHITYPLG